MKKKIVAVFGLGFLLSATIALANEDTSLAIKPSFYMEDGTYVQYLPEGGMVTYAPGEYKPTPIPGPEPIETLAPVIQCIKEEPPVRISPVFDENGEVIGKQTELETDPEVWKKIGYYPNKCDTDSELYITEYMNMIDDKVYKTTQIQLRTTTAPTPTPKVSLKNIQTKKLNGTLMAGARNTLKTFGFKVEWDKKRKILKATKGKKTLEFYQNSKLVKVDGKLIKRMSNFSKIQNGTLMVPLNFITAEFKDSIIK